jgi:hypothetical protein
MNAQCVSSSVIFTNTGYRLQSSVCFIGLLSIVYGQIS